MALSILLSVGTPNWSLDKIYQYWYKYAVMRIPDIPREKPLHWVSSAKRDYLGFPIAVQGEMGYALGLAQLGAKHPRTKPWKGQGTGIFEIIEDYRGDTYRAVYTVRFAKAVYVLHAFRKKSKSGIKTPQEDVTLIAERLKRAQADYESNHQGEAI